MVLTESGVLLAYISYQQLQMIVVVVAVCFLSTSVYHYDIIRASCWLLMVVLYRFILIKCKVCSFVSTFATYLRHIITCTKLIVPYSLLLAFLLPSLSLKKFQKAWPYSFSLIVSSRIRCDAADFDILLPLDTFKFLMHTITSTSDFGMLHS